MENKKFYEVTHKGRHAGFFKTKEAAENYAKEFNTNIEGASYPVEIITRDFLDSMYTEEDENQDDFNWDSGAV